MTKKTKKYIKYLCLSLFLLLIIAASTVVFYRFKEAKMVHNRTIGKEEIKKREAAFSKKPTISDAMFLIDRYYFLKDYDKALFYGKACVDLGVNDTPKGVVVNFQLAVIYKEMNKYDLASTHLKKALELDRNNIIQNNKWIENYGMQDVLNRASEPK